MIPVHGVYEIAIPVRNLAQAEVFYTETLGFTVGLRDEERNWVFLDTGGMTGMVVLTENTGEWPALHFAFAATDKADLDKAKAFLDKAGATTRGPVHHEWMGADSLYFNDPDGHALEFIWVPKADPHRRFASSAFNGVWDLLDKTDRTPEEDHRMILAALASRYHWEQIGTPTNRAVGEWQIARVYATLGMTESAVYHGEQGLALCRSAKTPPFFEAFAHESLARALCSTNPGAAREHLDEARRLAGEVEDADERKMLTDDLDTIEV